MTSQFRLAGRPLFRLQSRPVQLVALAFVALLIVGAERAVARPGQVGVHDAPEVESTLDFQLNFDQRSYQALQQRAGDRGVTSSTFAQWLVENGAVSLKAEGLEGEAGGKIVVALIDDRGNVTAEQALRSVRGGGLSVRGSNPLGRLTDAGEIGRVISGATSGDAFVLGSRFVESEQWTPERGPDTWAREASQRAASLGRRILDQQDMYRPNIDPSPALPMAEPVIVAILAGPVDSGNFVVKDIDKAMPTIGAFVLWF